MRGPTFGGSAPELHKYFFAFLLNRICFIEGTYFLGALPLNYIRIFLPFYLIGFFFNEGTYFWGALPLNYISIFLPFYLIGFLPLNYSSILDPLVKVFLAPWPRPWNSW